MLSCWTVYPSTYLKHIGPNQASCPTCIGRKEMETYGNVERERLIHICIKVSKGAKIRNRYNQVPHLTQDTNGKVTNSQ